MTTIMTTRGCPFRCIFCSQRTMFGTAVRYRSVNNILEEIEDVIGRYHIKHFAFIDDTLTLKREKDGRALPEYPGAPPRNHLGGLDAGRVCRTKNSCGL